MYGLGIIILLILMFLFMAIKILNEYERGVIFRLGRVIDYERTRHNNFDPHYQHMVPGESAHRDHGCAPTGCHYAGQRLRKSQCGHLLQGNRTYQSSHRG